MTSAPLKAAKQVWEKVPQSARYVLAGIVNTAAGYGIFAGCYLVTWQFTHYAIILIMSHVLAVTFSFLVHRNFVFLPVQPIENGAEKISAVRAWVKYQVSYVGILFLGLALNYFMLEWLKSTAWVSQAVSTAICVIAGYLVHKLVIFSKYH